MEAKQFDEYNKFEKVLLFKEFVEPYKIDNKDKEEIIKYAVRDGNRLFAAALQSYVEGIEFMPKLLLHLRTQSMDSLLDEADDFKSVVEFENGYKKFSFFVVKDWLDAYDDYINEKPKEKGLVKEFSARKH